MNKSLFLNRGFIALNTIIILIGSLVVLMKSGPATGNGYISLAITIDLLLTVPLIYFLIIRKTRIPKTTVVPVMIAGLLAGSFFLPDGSRDYLEFFTKWIMPLVEITILTYIIIKVRSAVKKFKTKKTPGEDFFSALKSTCYEMMPRGLVMPFITEISVFYYGFLSLKKRELKENEFSYHKKSGTPALMFAFIFIILVETLAFHLLLSRWNTTIAWIFTGLSLYTALQVFGFARAISKRPVVISGDTIILRYGILNETVIRLSDIERVRLSKENFKQDKEHRKLSPLGELERHNIVIHMDKEYKLTGLYGMQKSYRVLALHLDEAEKFLEKVKLMQEDPQGM